MIQGRLILIMKHLFHQARISDGYEKFKSPKYLFSIIPNNLLYLEYCVCALNFLLCILAGKIHRGQERILVTVC